jgi:hypothetical protein
MQRGSYAILPYSAALGSFKRLLGASLGAVSISAGVE